MQIFVIVLIVLLIGIQFPLWLGKGGWLKVMEMRNHNVTLTEKIEKAQARNAVMRLEVADLEKNGEAVEELARGQRGFVGAQEVFLQWRSDYVSSENNRSAEGRITTVAATRPLRQSDAGNKTPTP